MSENKLRKKLIIGGAGLAAAGLTFVGLKRFTDMLSYSIVEIKPGGFNGDHIKMFMDIDILNPSALSLPIQLKTAKILYNGNEIGTVLPAGIKLLAGKNTKLENLEIHVNPKRMGGLAWKLLTTQKDQLINSLLPKLNFKMFFKVMFFPFKVDLKYGEEPKQVGLVAAGRRDIIDGSKYNHLIAKPQGKTREVQKNASVDDTVKWAGFVVKTYHKDVEKLARYFESKSSTKKELFKNIFDFCYKHIQYKLDRQGVEELRTPATTWQHRVHGVDCDDFTMFIASILYCLKIPFEFRITKYGGKLNYQHIYLIVPVENGKHITIDPVLDKFNYEKPFSDHKDYNMKALSLAGTDGLGIPIEILAGTGNPEEKAKNLDNLYKVAYGYDLQGVLNGLGSAEDDSKAMLRYLKRLRNVYVTNPEYIADYQDPAQAVQMFDYAIKYWNTDKRQAALDKLAKIEDELIEQGQIKLEGFDDDDEGWEEDKGFSGVEPELAGYRYKYPEEIAEWEEDISFSGKEPELSGFDYRYEQPEWEEDYSFSGVETESPGFDYDYSVDGLGGRRRRRLRIRKPRIRFRRPKIKKLIKKIRARKPVRGMFRKISTGVKKGIKSVARLAVKAGATPLRLALLTALRTNVRGVSDKFKYAYLAEQQAIARGIDINEFRKLKQAHSKLENMFLKMGGKREALKKAILSGKRKDLRGFEQMGDTISGISELDGWEQDLGYSGREPENPQNEYKYDNQIWRVDEQFSGVETEKSDYEYDYSFDGLEGRRIRFRRRKRPKRRWFRKIFRRRKRPAPKPQPKTSYRPKNPTQKKRIYHEASGELMERVVAELKNVRMEKVLEKNKIKRDYLNFFAINAGHISTILVYGFKTEQEAIAEGVSSTDYQKIKTALQIAQNAISDYGGTAKEVNKAIILGKDKANLDGLGAVAAAAGAAAGLIGKIVSWIKDIKLKKQAKKQAKENFTASGGSKQEWKQEGKKRFKDQWAEQKQAQAKVADQTSLPAASTASLTEQGRSTMDFSEIIKDKFQPQAIKSAGGALLPDSATSDLPDTTPPDEDDDEGFWKKNKKIILVGGGVLVAGAAGYGIYRYNQKQEEEQKTPKGKALSGTGNNKKTTKKAPAKSKAPPKKITAVTLT